MQASFSRLLSQSFYLILIVLLTQIMACDVTDGVATDQESPRLIFESDVSVTENTSGTIYTATTDVTNPTFSLVTSDDSALFSISGNGELSFITAPQFDNNDESANIYTVQIQILDSDNVLDTLINVTVTVIQFNPAPALTDAAAQVYTENTAITTLNFVNTGGDLLTACTADSLPSGLQVTVSSDQTTCEINGTPTQLQAATTHTITATNTTGSSSATVSISVVVALPTLIDAAAQSYTENSVITTLSFVNNGGGNLTGCTADTLPAGLVVTVSADTTTCEITGTPTAIQTATVHTITATNDSGSDSATVTISVNVAPPVLADAAAQTYTTNIAIPTLSFANSGGDTLTSCTADTLPAGLVVSVSADTTTCEITGTPTAAQSATTHTITATNASGNSSATVSITVNLGLALPILADATAQSYMTGDAIPTLSFVNTGGGSLTNCTADTLPAGLVVSISSDASTCEITGTPTVAQSATVHTITATNATGSDSATVSITVILTTPFITTWQTTNPGTSNTDQVMISTNSSFTYDYNIDWGDGTSDNNVTGDITHTYASPGTYTVEISGTFPQIFFNQTGNDPQKLLSVEQWGNKAWRSMENAFLGASNLVVNATDTPDLSLVTNMANMFNGAAAFNQDISGWDVSTVTNMNSMFSGASSFNQDVSGWTVASVTDMSNMFASASVFNQPIGSWNTASVTNMSGMFNGASAFNQVIGGWTVSAVTDMSNMFNNADGFNQDISGWNVSAVTNMANMFSGASIFNQDISAWVVSSVTDMNNMFNNAAAFAQNISGWNVAAVTDMNGMFANATAFNQPIGIWDVSAVTNMASMFAGATAFNQDISAWTVSAVTDMNTMFSGALIFDQAIGGWNVSSVTNMSNMFSNTSAFNQDLSTWNVAAVTLMTQMFSNALSFDQDIGGWNVTSVTDMTGMFDGVTLLVSNYDGLLLGWSAQAVQLNVVFSGGNSVYSTAASIARTELIENFNWTINDGGPQPQ